jgi:nitrite reductase/ring-hydroxylating ferredoxin subunit
MTIPGPPRTSQIERISEDSLVTRRDYLRILVTISGGLAAAAIGVAIGVFPRRTGSAGAVRIAATIDPGQRVDFTYPTADDPAIAMRLPNGMLVAYSAVCTHLSCAVLWREGKLQCPCHEGRFSQETGEVLDGPPPRPLPRILLDERPDGVYATGAVA